MMKAMYASSEPAKSACPSPDAFLSAYRGAENIIVLTLTGGLSGSYTSAIVAQKMLKEEDELRGNKKRYSRYPELILHPICIAIL